MCHRWNHYREEGSCDRGGTRCSRDPAQSVRSGIHRSLPADLRKHSKPGIQELPGFCLNGQEDAMVKEPLKFKDGYLEIPSKPGIGVELSENASELYPLHERGSNSTKTIL